MNTPQAAFGPYTARPVATPSSFSLRTAAPIAFSLKIVPPK